MTQPQAQTAEPNQDDPNEDRAQGATPPAEPSSLEPPGTATVLTPEDLAAVRDLALKAHPDTVSELVGGATLGDLLASLEPARAAYRRVAEATAAQTQATPAAPAAPVVPAGGASRFAVDPDRLPPGEKIRRALADRT